MDGQFSFHVERRLWQDVVAVHVRRAGGKPTFLTGIEFAEIPEGGSAPEPALKISNEAAQRLADELWAAGFRPTQGKQSEGVAGALQGHLADMRAIAFHKLGIK